LTHSLHSYRFGNQTIRLQVPDPQEVRAHYRRQKAIDAEAPLPYWSQVWPAAEGLCRYLAAHTEMVRDKDVLELAAGLGLPSLLATRWARHVVCTDNRPEALDVVLQSARLNGSTNLSVRVLDWNRLPEDLHPDILLLSDVNYEPEAFPGLLAALQSFLTKGTVILLSTPQRLSAKPFLEQLLPWKREETAYEVQQEQEVVKVSVWKLSQ
jgi:predicted nicotinamide N-methyase